MNTRQIDLEEQSHKEAVAKRRRELQEAKEKGYMSGGTTEGRQLFINLFLPYAEALRRRLDEAMSGKASKWAQFANHTHQLSEELGIETDDWDEFEDDMFLDEYVITHLDEWGKELKESIIECSLDWDS